MLWTGNDFFLCEIAAVCCSGLDALPSTGVVSPSTEAARGRRGRMGLVRLLSHATGTLARLVAIQSWRSAMIRSRAGRALLLATAGIFLAISQVSGVFAASLTVGPNVDISGFADNEAETTVAVNPANPNNVVVVSNFQTADALMESVTFDGGAPWS